MQVVEKPEIKVDKPYEVCQRGECAGVAEWSPILLLRATPSEEPFVAELTAGFCPACRQEMAMGELVEDDWWTQLSSTLTTLGKAAPRRELLEMQWKPYDRSQRAFTQNLVNKAGLPPGAQQRVEMMSETVRFGQGEMALEMRATREPSCMAFSFVREGQRLVPWIGMDPVEAMKIATAFQALCSYAAKGPFKPIMPPIPPDLPEAELERLRRVMGGLAGFELCTAGRAFFEFSNSTEERSQADFDKKFDELASRFFAATRVAEHFGARATLTSTPADFEAVSEACRAIVSYRDSRPPAGSPMSDADVAAWAAKDMELLAILRATLFGRQP